MNPPQTPGQQIPVPTLPNLRDLGGWKTSDGKRVRFALLYRSTDLDKLDKAGMDDIARLDLRTIVDFRTGGERAAQPDRVPSGASLLVCDVLADSKESAPALMPKIMASPKDAGDIIGGGKVAPIFEAGYREIVSLPSALAAYRKFFTALADETRCPLLFHCTTGKDRTGWAAAVTLTLLGVSEEDVMRDYMLTNAQLLPALQPVLDQFSAAGGDPNLLKQILGVQETYLEAAFDEMRKRFGSFDAYLSDGLNIDETVQARLRTALTEEARA
ncbi:tyrosine-protein phosphatase [Roseibium sp. M-1]